MHQQFVKKTENISRQADLANKLCFFPIVCFVMLVNLTGVSASRCRCIHKFFQTIIHLKNEVIHCVSVFKWPDKYNDYIQFFLNANDACTNRSSPYLAKLIFFWKLMIKNNLILISNLIFNMLNNFNNAVAHPWWII